MKLSDLPKRIAKAFAASGDRNIIPTDSQIGITDGAASYTDGFPPLTRTKLSAGGIPPSGKDMNGVLYEATNIAKWQSLGGGYTYDSSYASTIGGYPKGARILRDDGQGYWLNTADDNSINPSTASAADAGWIPDLTGGVTTVNMTSSNYTLTPAEYGKPVIQITGTLTANVNLIFPAIAGARWIVYGTGTVNNYIVTCKTASGAGSFLLSGGRPGTMWCDGTNILAESVWNLPSASTGYMTLGNGIILQWGPTVAVDPSNDKVVSLPITFPSRFDLVLASMAYSAGSGQYQGRVAVAPNIVGRNNFIIRGEPLGAAYFFIAIGA